MLLSKVKYSGVTEVRSSLIEVVFPVLKFFTIYLVFFYDLCVSLLFFVLFCVCFGSLKLVSRAIKKLIVFKQHVFSSFFMQVSQI